MRALPLMLLVLAWPALAFEVDAFKTGMSRAEVKAKLASYDFERVQDYSDTTLIAYDTANRASNRQFVFHFCGDRLVALEQEMVASLRALMILVGNYNARFGQPMKVTAATNVTSIGERNVLAFHWRDGPDVVGVRYVVIAPLESLTVIHDAPNACWQVPRAP